MWGRGESGESESDWRGPGPCRHAAQHLARPTGRDSGAGQVLLGLMADLCAADAARGCAPRGREGAPLLELQEAWNRAGPVLGRGSPRRGALPVVVYAYNRPEYLREVIAGLRAARGVGDTLLVFSLDGAAREMVALVREIDFAAVRLLFHPAHPSLWREGAHDGVLTVKRHWLWLLREARRPPLVCRARGRPGGCWRRPAAPPRPQFFERRSLKGCARPAGTTATRCCWRRTTSPRPTFWNPPRPAPPTAQPAPSHSRSSPPCLPPSDSTPCLPPSDSTWNLSHWRYAWARRRLLRDVIAAADARARGREAAPPPDPRPLSGRRLSTRCSPSKTRRRVRAPCPPPESGGPVPGLRAADSPLGRTGQSSDHAPARCVGCLTPPRARAGWAASCFSVTMRYACGGDGAVGSDADLGALCFSKSFVNTAVAFNRSVAASLLRSDFAGFRDGWDWSVYHLIQTAQLLPCQPACTPRQLAPFVSRVRNVGRHGVTVNEDNADTIKAIEYQASGDAFERGFKTALLHVRDPPPHSGATEESLYMGAGIGFVK